MPGQDEWFDALYRENFPRMMRQATYLLRNQQIAEELVSEAFLILLYKREALTAHPNVRGWLSQTLKNLISDELKSARYRLELPLNEDIEIPKDDVYEYALSESLPKDMTPKEKEILVLYYEKQLSYEQIASRLHISVLNCRTRLFRAKTRCKELLGREENFLTL